MIALIEASRAGLMRREHWARNLFSGTIVGIVALPLAMAFAIASGVKPEQGLYTAIIAGLAVSLLGGTRLQIAGPTGAFVAILASVTAVHGVDGLLAATLMAGVILVLLGSRGWVRSSASYRIRSSPASPPESPIVIWVGQWRDFFGLPAVSGAHFHQKLFALFQVFPHWHMATTAIGVLALLIAALTSKVPRSCA